MELMRRILRFVFVGGINTLIDVGVFNLLILIFGFVGNVWLAIFNTISVSCAIINSYFMNRKWTFQNKNKPNGFEFFNFVGISAVGCLINTGIVYFGLFLLPLFGISELLGVNVLKIVATIGSMLWNYIGYSWLYRI